MDSERNFAAEALAILSGENQNIPQPEHLAALAGQMESVLREKKLIEELLATAMVDTGQKELYFPAEDLDRVRRHGVTLTVIANPRGIQGAVLVAISPRRPVTVN